MRTGLLLIFIMNANCAESPFGTWRVDAAKSSFPGHIQLKGFSLRIEPHAKGEIFTLETVAGDGRVSTFSSILYFDGKPRDFQDSTCLGKQSSHRVDSQTVEILRECVAGQVRLIRRAEKPSVLILEITEQNSDGHRSERRLVMEKQ
jgi:hypothetical protein